MLASLSGCLGAESVLIAPQSRHSPPMSDGELRDYDPERTFESREVGDPDAVSESGGLRPHSVGVWNASSGERRIRVELAESEADDPHFSETLAFPADSELSFRLLEPATYVIRLRVPASGVRETLQVPRETFDCNASSTSIGVFGYEIRSSYYSTLVLCDADVTVNETTGSD